MPRAALRTVALFTVVYLVMPAVSRAEEVGFRDGDIVLLCVKSQDTDPALVEIRAAGGDPQSRIQERTKIHRPFVNGSSARKYR